VFKGARKSADKVPLACCPAPPQKKGASGPQTPSIGQQLLDLRIDRHRRSGSLPIKELLIHQLPEPVEGVGTTGLTEREQKPAARALNPEAAMGMGVRVNVGVTSEKAIEGAAQDPPQRRGGVKDPR
jgi:hypothetical protein